MADNPLKRMDPTHYQKLRNMYMAANMTKAIYETTDCSIEAEKATISLEVSEKYFHALNAMHGSVYFKLLDDSAFFAVNSVVEDVFVLTTSFQINLIRPVSSGRVTAIGQLKFRSKELFVATSTLYNAAGKEIGFGTGNFVKSKMSLTEDIGYKL